MGLAQSLRAVVGQFGGARDDYDAYADDDAFAGPVEFEDAQQIADRLRAGTPFIVDLQSCGRDLSKRLTDFCSGLTYALEGSLQYIGEKVVLLAPHNVELSSEAPGGLQERRFFNQV